MTAIDGGPLIIFNAELNIIKRFDDVLNLPRCLNGNEHYIAVTTTERNNVRVYERNGATTPMVI